MKKLLILFTVLIAVCLTGCVTSSPYKSDPSHPIKAVNISKDVPMPKKMIFVGLSEQFAGMFGGVAGALSTMYREGETFNLPEVMRADLSAELAAGGKFKVVPSGGDAEIRIHVREYGFVQARGFMRKHVKPILTIETQMVRRDGTQVWQSGVVINQNTKDTPEVLPEDLKTNPKVAADALHAAAKAWAAKTAASLR
jgi:hypothetical protein